MKSVLVAINKNKYKNKKEAATHEKPERKKQTKREPLII